MTPSNSPLRGKTPTALANVVEPPSLQGEGLGMGS